MTAVCLRSSCIPIRYNGNGCGVDKVEILLVTRKCGRGWIFPKGGWENDEQTPKQAAMRETVEEAGARGEIEEPILGIFPFLSEKHGLEDRSSCQCLAYMYVMRVEQLLDEWPEQQERQRCWFSLPEVCDRCMQGWMRKALCAWVNRKGWNDIVPQLQVPPKLNSQQSNGISPGIEEPLTLRDM